MYLYVLKLIFPALKENKKNTAIVTIGTLSLIGLSVAFNKWRSFFYDKIQAYDAHSVYLGLLYFSVLAIAFVFIAGITVYYQRYLEFGCRQFLFNKYISRIDSGVNNVEQIVQEDTIRISQNTLALLKATLDASIRLPVFLFILASTAKLWMVAVVVIYALGGTFFSRKVARKLIDAEFVQESLEAKLRRDLISTIKEKTELPTLKDIMSNWGELALRNKLLSYYTSFYGQISVIFPFIMLMPMFLDKTITLGVLFATTAAIGEVLSSLSVFIENRDILVNINMQAKRIKTLG
jgi:putative ATP-binding cassette transporter